MAKPVKKTKIKGNIWEYVVGKKAEDQEAKGHPAPFPCALATNHINSWTNEGDVVLDPMNGSGTTCISALQLNRQYIGIDISHEYCELARERIARFESQQLTYQVQDKAYIVFLFQFYSPFLQEIKFNSNSKYINKGKMKKIFGTIVLFIMVSCSKDDGITPSDDTTLYERTVVPTAIEDMYVGKGSVAQDTVIVYAEGGPEPTLFASDIEETAFSDFYRVYVKQAQQINKTITQNEISFEDAIAEDQISTEMYQSVLKHFVDQGKVVIAMSHSFGSFILANVLAKNPNVADKYIIMAGRLDIPDVVWQGFRDGELYTFTNGTTPIADGGEPKTGGALSGFRL